MRFVTCHLVSGLCAPFDLLMAKVKRLTSSVWGPLRSRCCRPRGWWTDDVGGAAPAGALPSARWPKTVRWPGTWNRRTWSRARWWCPTRRQSKWHQRDIRRPSNPKAFGSGKWTNLNESGRCVHTEMDNNFTNQNILRRRNFLNGSFIHFQLYTRTLIRKLADVRIAPFQNFKENPPLCGGLKGIRTGSGWFTEGITRWVTHLVKFVEFVDSAAPDPQWVHVGIFCWRQKIAQVVGRVQFRKRLSRNPVGSYPSMQSNSCKSSSNGKCWENDGSFAWQNNFFN